MGKDTLENTKKILTQKVKKCYKRWDYKPLWITELNNVIEWIQNIKTKKLLDDYTTYIFN